MSGRFFSIGASILVLAALLIGPASPVLAGSGGPTVAHSAPNSASPKAPTAWTLGPTTAFPGATGGWTRFDGEYYPGNGRVYFLGGRDGSNTYGDVYYFDPVAGTFTAAGVSMPVPVSNYDIALLSDGSTWGMYVFGGRPSAGGTVSTTQVYYPATNTVADLTATDPMPLVATGTTTPVAPNLAVYNNKAYVFGGFENTAPPYHTAETWQFDATAPAGSRWTNLNAPLNMARAYISTALVDGKIYAVGGDVFDGASLTPQSIVERLDTANIAAGWDDAGVADLPLPSSGEAGCDESRAFGFNTNSPFTGMAGTVVLAGCGQWDNPNGSALTDTFLYTVSSNSWASFETLNLARRNHAGALIPVAGGTGNPAMWVFNGYSSDGLTNTNTTEYRTLTGTPTSVELAKFTGSSSETTRPWAGSVLWATALAGLALVGLAVGLNKRRA